jgi:hypothetical protein
METTKTAPLAPDVMIEELDRMERLTQDALEADFSGTEKNWSEMHVKCRHDLATAVATARQLLIERDQARAEAAQLRARLLRGTQSSADDITPGPQATQRSPPSPRP